MQNSCSHSQPDETKDSKKEDKKSEAESKDDKKGDSGTTDKQVQDSNKMVAYIERFN